MRYQSKKLKFSHSESATGLQELPQQTEVLSSRLNIRSQRLLNIYWQSSWIVQEQSNGFDELEIQSKTILLGYLKHQMDKWWRLCLLNNLIKLEPTKYFSF